MTRYIARWGVWGPRELDQGAFVSMVEASMPAGWRILEDDLLVVPERVTLVPHTPTPEEATAPRDPGSVDLEVQGGRYAGWWQAFTNAQTALLGAAPVITGYRLTLEAPATLDAAARRSAQRAINTALARYEAQGFFSHNPGVTLREQGEPDTRYAAIDRPSRSGGSGILLAAAVVALGALAYSTKDNAR